MLRVKFGSKNDVKAVVYGKSLQVFRYLEIAGKRKVRIYWRQTDKVKYS